jgi:Raf kinase inhibitor-like YbhB/YbcL family protein
VKRNALEWAIAPLGRLLTGKRAGPLHSVTDAPDLAAKRDTPIVVTSHSFADGGEIPGAHTALPKQRNISPDLEWTGVPSAAKQLLLIMEDADVPFERPNIHMCALFPATITHFDDGDLEIENPAVRFVVSSRGRTGYYGPRPFPGHGRHHYTFNLYALDFEIAADAEVADIDALRLLVDGHVLAKGVLTGWKQR